MSELVGEELITFSASMDVQSYERLIAHAKVVEFDVDYFLECLVDLYAVDFTKEMLGVR